MSIQDQRGIWKYADELPFIPKKFRLSLNEGQTRMENIKGIWFKYEHENPTGSIKDRSMAYQMSNVIESGFKSAVISSSGNAAISAVNYALLSGIDLKIFVSPKINKAKLDILQKSKFEIIIDHKPISSAYKYASKNKSYNLRQSIDLNALYGYETVSYEIINSKEAIDAIFIPVSGGTIFEGTFNGFKKQNNLFSIPAFHAVQTEMVNPVSRIFDSEFKQSSTSLADAIVAKFSPRFKKAEQIIKETKGFAWTISDKEMTSARLELEKSEIYCSFEGAALLAAYQKTTTKGFKYTNPLVILTGKKYE